MSGPGSSGGSAGERETTATTSGPSGHVLPSGPIAEAELAETPDDQVRPVARAWTQRLTTTAAVSLGGLLGANARFLIGVWAADRWGSMFPWGTLAINVTGSFVLGFYLTLVTERFAGRPTTRLFVATGFLGAYTTFSTFSFETVRLVQQGHVAPALAYVAASLIAGLAAVLVGVAIAHAL